ncbi:MAG: LysR substrate-binding domain-containing protein [Opitutales bacterium]
MDLRKLSYFLAVAEELSFSRAARRLGVTQPVVSRAIKEIEAMLDAKLFFRESSAIKLTPAGEAFLPRAEEALDAIDEGVKSVRDISAKGGAIIDIGYLPSSYKSFVGDALNVFCQAFPGTRVNPHPMDAGPMIEALRSGKIDVAFIGHICPEVEREFDTFKLCEIPLSVVVAMHHPLAQKEFVEIEDLKGLSLISLEADNYPGRHELITSQLRRAGISPKSIRRVDNLLSVLANIASSDAFSLMPAEVESVATDHVKFIQINGFQGAVDYHALVRRDESRKMVLALLQECRRIIQAK